MCICNVCLCSNFFITDKIMTTMFIFTHFGLNICHPFLYFATLKGFVFIIGKLVWLWCSNSFKIEKPTWQRIMTPPPPPLGLWLCPPNAICPPLPPEACARHWMRMCLTYCFWTRGPKIMEGFTELMIITLMCPNHIDKIVSILLTWVRSTCTDWPDIRLKRQRGSWRRWTSRRVRSRRADCGEAGRYRAWREGRRSHGPLTDPAAAYCLYQAEREREREWKWSNKAHYLFFWMH